PQLRVGQIRIQHPSRRVVIEIDGYLVTTLGHGSRISTLDRKGGEDTRGGQSLSTKALRNWPRSDRAGDQRRSPAEETTRPWSCSHLARPAARRGDSAADARRAPGMKHAPGASGARRMRDAAGWAEALDATGPLTVPRADPASSPAPKRPKKCA